MKKTDYCSKLVINNEKIYKMLTKKKVGVLQFIILNVKGEKSNRL